MIVDTSAIVAVARGEETSRDLKKLLLHSTASLMSAVSFVELCAVLRADCTSAMIDELLEALGVTPVPVTVEQARMAAEAYRRFGKGSGSPARLNFGDTFSYALAKATGRPLLFVGDDFSHTDITRP